MRDKTRRILALVLSIGLLFQQTGFAQIVTQLDISGYLTKLPSSIASDRFRPLHLRYLSYDPQGEGFKLLLDKGDAKSLKDSTVEQTTKELLNYFFVGVTLPNSSFWVNLRPDSPDNIIDPALAQTDVGKILLEADLQLKKDTALMTSPQTPEGREYWDKLYKKAGELFGSENITIPTLTRPWIVPGEIIIREAQDNAYIYKAILKVMLEQDYLKDSAVYNFKDDRLKQLNEYSSQLIRELIIPKLTKEVNSSKRYAPLRQVYYSLILAQWFKQHFQNRGGYYSQLIDRRNLTALTSQQPWSKTTYFQEYQKSFKDGEYNIQEPVYTTSGQTIRSYFSGGVALQQTPRQPLPTGESLIDTPAYTEAVLASGTPDKLNVDFEITPQRGDSGNKVASLKIDEYKETNNLPSGTKVVNLPDGQKIYILPSVLGKYKKLDAFVRKNPYATENWAFGLTKRTNGDIILLDLVIPEKSLDLGGLFYTDEEAELAKLIYHDNDLHLKLEKEAIVLINGMGEKLYLDKMNLGIFKKHFSKLIDINNEILSNYDELKKYIKKHGEVRLSSFDLIVSGRQVVFTDSYELRVEEIAKKLNAEINFAVHYHPNPKRLYLSNDKEIFKKVSIKPSKEDLSTARELGCLFLEMRTLGSFEQPDNDYEVTSKVYVLSSSPVVDERKSSLPLFSNDAEAKSYLLSTWQEFCNRLGTTGDSDKVFNEIMAQYSDKKRAYHTFKHIIAMLKELEEVKHLAANPNALKLAIWLHDVIYDSERHDNEEQSVQYAYVVCHKLGLTDDFTKRVGDLILVTKHHQIDPSNTDTQIIVDLDLTILGAPFDVYDEYEKGIRIEYGWVPSNIYQIERIKILNNFLEKAMDSSLYNLKYFKEKYEKAAKSNIGRAIETLKSSSPLKQRTEFGGIDFRSLPIVTQAISNLNAGLSLSRLNGINLDSEWQQIESLVNSRITPSAERIKEYVQASCYKGYAGQDKRKIILCISEILRQEEETCSSTEPALKDILLVLESGRSNQELRAIFTGTKF